MLRTMDPLVINSLQLEAAMNLLAVMAEMNY